MSDPKAECETLMNAVLPFAEQMLVSYGEFFSFGGAMRPNGEMVSIGSYDGQEHPKSADVIALMKKCLIAAARKGEYKATAIVHDARLTLPSGEASDAITVSLNHRDNYSIVVFFPYKIESGTLTFRDAIAQKGEADIFPQGQA